MSSFSSWLSWWWLRRGFWDRWKYCSCLIRLTIIWFSILWDRILCRNIKGSRRSWIIVLSRGNWRLSSRILIIIRCLKIFSGKLTIFCISWRRRGNRLLRSISSLFRFSRRWRNCWVFSNRRILRIRVRILVWG